jgi:hypothetical protein
MRIRIHNLAKNHLAFIDPHNNSAHGIPLVYALLPSNIVSHFLACRLLLNHLASQLPLRPFFGSGSKRCCGMRIHDILVWIRIRGAMPLTNGSESCYFDLQDVNKKQI